ncbi:PD-(D/E)XK nuclease family protein [Salinimicrobium sp. TIG7-5_MAKvit]|uniref:PD-(D/E)XK nuclease family protein n=1 Tax=Salinimicrobium sp. TIG7-5_MAKvit TaxID=3121289 RepID=UPI003C6DEA15
MKPNIFDIATKELHQDAFITWLLQYSDKQYEIVDPLLNKCGREFITKLIQTKIPDFEEEINTVVADRQWDNIDVRAKINNKYLIIIEDKTVSSFHSNQLERYQKSATIWCVENDYLEPICIYLKTGNDSKRNLKKVMDKGYTVFQRQDFLAILTKYQKCSNDIFIDFYNRLKRLEKINNQFEQKEIGDWDGNDWQGFFQFLEREIHLVNWHYVNNPAGGFWNAIVNWKQWGNYPAYVQIEEGKLCFKVSTHPEDIEFSSERKRSAVRNDLHQLIMKQAEKENLVEIETPRKFGNGNYMTVAIVKRHNWLGKKESTIDPKDVVNNIKKYRKFLDRVIQTSPKEYEKTETTGEIAQGHQVIH